MDAIPLFTEDGKRTNVSYCSKCKIPAPHDLAETCCTTSICEFCGKDTGYRSMKVCPSCQDKHAMDKAEKLESWDGPVVHNDHYYESLGGLLDCNEVEDLPEFVYVAETEHIKKLDAEHILECLIEDLYDGAYDSLEGIDDFIKAVDAFNEANTNNTYWMESRERAVRVQRDTVQVTGEEE